MPAGGSSSGSDSGSEDSVDDDPPFPTLPGDVDFRAVDFVGSQGLRLKAYRFAHATRPCRGMVFMCHGYGGHTQFDWLLPGAPGEPHVSWATSVLEGLVDAGYVVHALDQQSHGRSEGQRGLRAYFDDFDDLPGENLEYLRSAIPGEPPAARERLFVFGISMGGATAVRMSQLEPDLFRGMVLYAPMLRLEEVKKEKIFACITNGHLAGVAGCLSKAIPFTPVAKAKKNDMFPLSQKEADEDALVYHGDVRSRVGAEFMRIAEGFMGGGLESVSVPFVTFHAQHDTFVDPKGSQVLLDVAKSTDKTYMKVGRGLDVDVDIWHGLSFEPGHEVILKAALAWMVERSGGVKRMGGDAPRSTASSFLRWPDSDR